LMIAPAFFGIGDSTHALESPWTPAQQSAIRLIAAGPAAPGDTRLKAGVEIKLTPGWHTYWRYPGDAGVPPRFDWGGSENLAGVDVLWPAPERILASGSVSIGYDRDVIFPLRVRPADPARPVKLALKLEYAVCAKICIPAEARVRLDVPASGAAPVPALVAAEANVPRRVNLGEAGSLAITGVKLERGAVPRVLVTTRVPPGSKIDLFAEGPTEEWALPVPEKLPVEAGMVRFAFLLEGAPSGTNPIPPKLRLTLVAGEQAIEVEAPLD
jgi:DsbC/DsbD-like thiol-disulfide interchange protein